MASDIEILLSKLTDDDTKYDAIKNIINIYDLHLTLTPYEIFVAFETIMRQMNVFTLEVHTRCKFLFEELLNKNKFMFIAIIKAKNDKNSVAVSTLYIFNFTTIENSIYSIGFNQIYSYQYVVKSYCILLDYIDFSIDNLKIPDTCKIEIQNYKNENSSFFPSMGI